MGRQQIWLDKINGLCQCFIWWQDYFWQGHESDEEKLDFDKKKNSPKYSLPTLLVWMKKSF